MALATGGSDWAGVAGGSDWAGVAGGSDWAGAAGEDAPSGALLLVEDGQGSWNVSRPQATLLNSSSVLTICSLRLTVNRLKPLTSYCEVPTFW
jgi:hypothetical protein